MQQIKDEVLRILREHQVQKPDPALADSSGHTNGAYSNNVDEATDKDGAHVSVVNRHTRGDPSSRRPTILVESDWDEPTSATTWPAAILDIRSAIQSLWPLSAASDLDIEFIASPSTREIALGRDIFRDYRQRFWGTRGSRGEIAIGVSQILDELPHVREFVTAYGPDPVDRISHAHPWPIIFNVVVSEESSEADWPPVVNALTVYLRESIPDIDARVAFSHGDF